MIYNLNLFGEMFQALRTTKGYSYNTLSDEAGIAKNTLRNIERGKVIPTLDTLSILSSYLSVDLSTLFLSCKNNRHSRFDKLRRDFDRMVATHQTDRLFQHMHEAESLLSLVPSADEDDQLHNRIRELYYRMIGHYESFVKKDDETALRAFLKAMWITMPDFLLDEYSHQTYNYDELQIFFNIVQMMARREKRTLHLTMYQYIYETYETLVETEVYLLPTLLNNMSVLYMEAGHLIKALHYANLGLDYIKNEQIMIDLPALLLCKGLILYHMSIGNHDLYITSALNLLNINNRQDIVKMAIKDMISKHGLDYRGYMTPMPQNLDRLD